MEEFPLILVWAPIVIALVLTLLYVLLGFIEKKYMHDEYEEEYGFDDIVQEEDYNEYEEDEDDVIEELEACSKKRDELLSRSNNYLEELISCTENWDECVKKLREKQEAYRKEWWDERSSLLEKLEIAEESARDEWREEKSLLLQELETAKESASIYRELLRHRH